MLADEVGLGKTFVAKQVINLVREWHKQEKDDFFKVVYICSNANIADQNIEKLGVENRDEYQREPSVNAASLYQIGREKDYRTA